MSRVWFPRSQNHRGKWPVKTESIVKQRKSWNWLLIDEISVFREKKGCFYVGRTFNNARNHQCITSQTLLPSRNNLRMSKRSPEKREKNSLHTLKCRAEQLPNDFYVSGDMLYGKICQHNVDWKCLDACEDHLQCKAHMIKRETPYCTHFLMVKFAPKGEKIEF